MVRNVRVEVVDNVSRPVIAVGNDYADGHVIAPHQHRRGQLISGASGAGCPRDAAGYLGDAAATWNVDTAWHRA